MQLDFRKDPSLLQSIVDVMPHGLFTVDAQGRFVAWSAGAERITGYRAEEVIGQPCRLLEGPNCKGFGQLAEMLKSTETPCGGICDQECKIQGKDGREVFIHGSVRLLTENGGPNVGAVGSFSDVTSLVQANERIALLERSSTHREAFERLVGSSPVMQEVYHRIRLAADSDVTVFISGESGTGKELAAQAIHMQSDRRDKPFIAVNCSAIPETLLESELFGHVKGAFTGAVRERRGVFQAAEGGTILLDEIGDVSPLLQLKLLRVLQEREIRRVGDDLAVPVDVRVVTATNRDLKALIRSGEFREDFYYRIHVFEIAMPPLRERRGDIPLLVQQFIREFAHVHRKVVTGISRDALEHLLGFAWPGNVRELRNAIEHGFVTVQGDTITLLDLPPELRANRTTARTGTVGSVGTGPEKLTSLTPQQQAEKLQIEEMLRQTAGNKTEAARRLGFSRVTMWKKARKYGIG